MKINLLIDTIPYIPDVFNNSPALYLSDNANNSQILPTHQTIFIFCLNSENANSNFLNIYNNPYFMLFGLLDPLVSYNLPPISYFSTNSTIDYITNPNILKTIYTSNIFTPEINELLTNIGFDISQLYPPSTYSIPSTSPIYNTDILFQKIIVYDAVSGRNDEIIFIFFYQDYINDNPIHLNNSYINNTTQTPLLSSVFYNQKNWNVFIYPYTDELDEFTTSPTLFIPLINNISNTTNSIETINFNNKDYIPYINKLDYKYFENYDFIKNENSLNTSIYHSKNLITFGNYYTENNDDTIFVGLNEITKNDDINNYINSNSELNTIKFLKKSNSYSNINSTFSMTTDNKLSYVNKKNINDISYSPYFFSNTKINTMYPICKNFFINTYVNINSSFQSSLNDFLQSTNWYIRKLLIHINPQIIYNPNIINLKIFPIINCLNELIVNGIQVNFVSSTIISTHNYYIDRFILVVSWTEETSSENINFVYYIVLNIAYYNGNKFIIYNTKKTSNIDDLGYINFTYVDYSNTLIPNIFKNLKEVEILNNLVSYNLVDTKYYSFSINYNKISTNETQNNLIFINHFYFLIPYVKPIINYINSTDEEIITLPISNIYNVLEKKVNNFIMNTILLNDNFNSIRFNNYNAESIFKLSITFDSNILNDYYKCISEERDCQDINYIQYLQYINKDFGGDVIPYIQPNNTFNNNSYNTVMIPTGNYIVFKYHNNFIKRDNVGNIISMTDDIVISILCNNEQTNFDSISLYNFALLIKMNDDFNPDDKFFVENQNLYTTDFLNIFKYLCNQGNYQTKMYLVLCNTDYSLYYFQENYLLGIELFNNYNGNTSNQLFLGNKVFINMVLTEYMNFYVLNFFIDVYDNMKQNNNLCFDKNKLLFKRHKNNLLKTIIKYDSKRFNSYIPDNDETNFWDDDIILKLETNKILVNYMKVLDNNLIFILNCNKIINLLKRCIVYLNQIKIIIFFENLVGFTNNWSNNTISKDEFINIINYLATCCMNINKVNQIINITYCYENTTIDDILTNLVYLTNSITIQTINEYILKIQNSMIFYSNRMTLIQNQIFEIFTEIDKYNNEITDYKTYKHQYIKIIKEIYVNDIILYAINQDIFKIFNDIIIKPTINHNDYILNFLTETINIIDVYKLNINILKETLNFVRLFYDDKTVYCIYEDLNDNIIKTNYIYNTLYYNDENNLPNINIFTFFPPDPLSTPPAIPLIIPTTLTATVISNIRNLIIMISDTYKYPLQTCHLAPFYNIFTETDFDIFIETLDELIENSNTLFNLQDPINPPNTYMQTYMYSWDIIQKFISNCIEIKLFVKCMFFLDNIEVQINNNYFLFNFTNASNYIESIQNMYSTIKKINTEPSFVIKQYQGISNLLLEQIAVSNLSISPSTVNFIFNPYNEYSIMVCFLKGLYNLKMTLLNEFKMTIFDDVFDYMYLGYYSEDIIPFNDYNLLIDQRSLLYTIFPKNNIYNPTANIHTFNNNPYIIELLEIFNENKKTINEYYLSFDNTDYKYSFIFNALNYGYIYTDYVFINIDNVNIS
jgi:hypothetical protein